MPSAGRRSTGLAILLFSTLLLTACGDIFRPVAVPIPVPTPDPKEFHFAMVVNQNAPGNPGSGMQIDVSGDTNVGVAKTGLGPVHAVLLPPNGNRVFIANNLDDTVTTFAASILGSVIGTPITITLPTGSAPLFVHTTEGNAVYVANYGTSTIGVIIPTGNALSQLIPLAPTSLHPIALAETPNGQKLYSVNQGGGAVPPSVTSINTVDKTINQTITGFSAPVWAVASLDSNSIYVLDQGTGQISVINTFTDTITASVAVGGGANFMILDRRLNRLYVSNPAANTVTILNAAVSPQSAPTIVATIPVPANPNMIAPLYDGTRAYVLTSQVTATSVNSQVTVIRTLDNAVVATINLNPVDLTTVPAGALAACSAARFRQAIASSGDSSRIYVSSCDAASTAILRTSDDVLVLDLNSPVSAYTPVSGTQPPAQNPVWVVAGP